VYLKYQNVFTFQAEKQRINELKTLIQDAKQFQNEHIVIIGDFNDNYGSKSLQLLVNNDFINLLFTKKYTGSFYDKYTYWKDTNNNDIIEENEVRDLDHMFVNYNMYRSVSIINIDHVMPHMIADVDKTLDVYKRSRLSNHWALIAIIQ
jgi:endonuclease/exonuclease/phosphatase family metal-dependent hydrolase